MIVVAFRAQLDVGDNRARALRSLMQSSALRRTTTTTESSAALAVVGAEDNYLHEFLRGAIVDGGDMPFGPHHMLHVRPVRTRAPNANSRLQENKLRFTRQMIIRGASFR